ncbi:MAG: cupredoxin domain-containing protein [Microthrixaceae bacterium]|nr:cupredoxin domain-containing protein [Microthrixaceae bacterium]
MTDTTTTEVQTTQGSGRVGGTTFETLAISAFIFGIFAIVAAVFAIGMSARAVEVANGGGGGSKATTGGGGGGAAEVQVKATEFAFDPKDIKVAENGKIILDNAGAVQHDFQVEGLTMDMVDPGKTGELVLTGLAPGEYTFICTVPGHEAAGMKGTITVG